jgi:hypothetical protein
MPEDELPDITPETPTVTPAIPEKSYDKLWMDSLNISSPLPTQLARVSFSLKPYDGVDSVLQSPVINKTIPDAFGLAAKDPQFAQVMAGVIAMVNKYKDVDFSRGFTVVDGQIVYDPIPEPTPEPEQPVEPPADG